MPIRSVTLRIGGDARGARRAGEEALAIGDKVDSARPTLHIGADLPTDAVAGLQAQVEALTGKAHDINVGMNLEPGDLAKLATLNAALVGLTKSLEGRSVIGIRGFAKTQAQLATVAAGLTKLGTMHVEPEVSLHVDTHPLDKLLGAASKFSLGALFSGGLFSLTSWHFIIDGFVELAAVVIPATIALAAFGFAAYHTFDLIGIHLKNVYTVATATGQVIKPMSQSFHDLQNAVRPQAMELFGQALLVVNNRSSEFSVIARNAGAVVDNWGAHIAADMSSGSSAIGLMAHSAVHDLSLIGDIVATLGTALGRLFRVAETTHIAEDLLGVVNVAGKLLIAFTELPTPIVATVFALHGIWLWGRLALGLLSSFGNAIIRPWIGLGGALLTAGTRFGFIGDRALKLGNAIGVAYPALDKMHSNLEKMAVGAEDGAVKTGLLAGSLNILKAIPVWGWVAIGAVALGALAFALLRVKDKTQQWIDSLQSGLLRSPITNSISKIYNDITKINSQLTAAEAPMRKYGQNWMVAAGGMNAAMAAGKKIGELTSGEKILTDQSQLLVYRLGLLSTKYGITLPETMAVADLAGVKMKDMLDGQRSSLLLIEMKIGGLIAGYRAMGQSANMVGQDINALTFASSDQMAAMQKVNQAFDAFTQIVAGPTNGFVDFARSVVQFTSDAKTAHSEMNGFGGAIQTVAHHVTTASLQLQSDFQSSFTSAQQLFDAMRLAGEPSGAMVTAMKDAVAVLLPLTRGNKEALAQVSALAQEVGGPATTSMQKLTDWTGKIHDPLRKLQDQSQKTSVAVFNLSEDAKKLSTTLSQDLNNMIAKVVLSTSNVQGAMVKYTGDLRANRTETQQGKTDRQNLYDDLMKVFHNSTTANTAIRILTQGTLGLHKAMSLIKNVTAGIDLKGHGAFSITQLGSLSKPGGKLAGPLATGGRIPGYGGGDKWLAMLEGGEAVVPKHLTPSVAPFLRTHGVPGFASGMVPNPYNGNVAGLGPWVSGFDHLFTGKFISAMESSMSSAMKSAMASAAAAFKSGPPASGSAAAAMRFAQGLLGAYGWGASQWPPLRALWMQESGWNANAVNPSSGAYGIPQALGHGHPFNLGDYANQIRWGLSYIKGRYGSPSAAEGHELSAGWYDRGGLLMPGLTLAMNNTGKPELVTPLSSPNGAVSRPAMAGDVYNITVKGDTNPDAAAMRIIQIIRRFKQHHGGQPTGIG